mmetsp:Transcript_29843/g.75077  ORF Transcript_29843/g.75077 Transcript_29843/m.75077 type:complete len:379 (-) Transcript_29843:321-1457(-)
MSEPQPHPPRLYEGVEPTEQDITLSWDGSSVRYELQFREHSTTTNTEADAGTEGGWQSATDKLERPCCRKTGLTPGLGYAFRVRGFKDGQWGPFSPASGLLYTRCPNAPAKAAAPKAVATKAAAPSKKRAVPVTSNPGPSAKAARVAQGPTAAQPRAPAEVPSKAAAAAGAAEEPPVGGGRAAKAAAVAKMAPVLKSTKTISAKKPKRENEGESGAAGAAAGAEEEADAAFSGDTGAIVKAKAAAPKPRADRSPATPAHMIKGGRGPLRRIQLLEPLGTPLPPSADSIVKGAPEAPNEPQTHSGRDLAFFGAVHLPACGGVVRVGDAVLLQPPDEGDPWVVRIRAICAPLIPHSSSPGMHTSRPGHPATGQVSCNKLT